MNETKLTRDKLNEILKEIAELETEKIGLYKARCDAFWNALKKLEKDREEVGSDGL